jgi:hypothetical protein
MSDRRARGLRERGRAAQDGGGTRERILDANTAVVAQVIAHFRDIAE